MAPCQPLMEDSWTQILSWELSNFLKISLSTLCFSIVPADNIHLHEFVLNSNPKKKKKRKKKKKNKTRQQPSGRTHRSLWLSAVDVLFLKKKNHSHGTLFKGCFWLFKHVLLPSLIGVLTLSPQTLLCTPLAFCYLKFCLPKCMYPSKGFLKWLSFPPLWF